MLRKISSLALIACLGILLTSSIAFAQQRDVNVLGHSPNFQDSTLTYEVGAGSTIKDAFIIINSIEDKEVEAKLNYIGKKANDAENKKTLPETWLTVEGPSEGIEVPNLEKHQINIELKVPSDATPAKYVGSINVTPKLFTPREKEEGSSSEPLVSVEVAKTLNVVVNVTEEEGKTFDYLSELAEKEELADSAKSKNALSNTISDNIWIFVVAIIVIGGIMYVAKSKKD